jgi:hydroxypyruvate isomerase
MIKSSLCIEPVLENLDFYDRIKVASDIGFNAVEFWDPVGKDVSKIGNFAQQAGIKVSICCIKDAWQKRMNFSSLMVMENVSESIKLAKEMDCNSLIGLSGDVEGCVDTQKNILIENLKRVADILVKENVTLNIEALNSLVNHKGYYLNSSYLGFEIIKSVNCPNIKLLYDVYHMQIMEGNIIENVTNNIEFIGHFHSAGVPGRHEIMRGENDYKNILEAIQKCGYDRFFGLEYLPTYENEQSLKDTKKFIDSCVF